MHLKVGFPYQIDSNWYTSCSTLHKLVLYVDNFFSFLLPIFSAEEAF